MLTMRHYYISVLAWIEHPSIHPFAVATAVSAETLHQPLPRHFHQLFHGVIKALPGQPRNAICPAYPGARLAPPASRTSLKHLT